MIERRARQAGIQTKIGNHSLRATGITDYLKSDGSLAEARRMANHSDTVGRAVSFVALHPSLTGRVKLLTIMTEAPMANQIGFIGLFLLATATFGQHAGGWARGGMSAGPVHSAGFVRPPFTRQTPTISGNRLRLGHRLGNGNFVPYYGFPGSYGDYGVYPDDLGMGAYPPVDYGFYPPPQPPPVTYAVPAQTAHAVVNEYKWKTEAPLGTEPPPTFTISLKDGSTRQPVATWVQDGKLHFVDSRGRQDVLSSDRIDRDATQRLNSEKNLHLQLPPG